jgi:predicted NBD/HSP70 family sugar kinase
MGDFNQAVILDSIRRSVEGLSRVELAGSAGLAAQTVSNICRRLLDAGLIMEAGKEASGPGKPRTILRLNPKGMYAVGVHIDPAVTSISLVDAIGTVLESLERPTDLASTPEDSVAAMGREIRAVIDRSGVDRLRVAGVGVATPGPIDAATGTVVDPPHMPGWRRVPVRSILQEATGLVYIYIGTGIGAGLILGDEVVRGSSGNAGEIGHIITDPDGPECDCGRRGCVKANCMPETLVAEARDLGVLPPADPANPIGLAQDLAALAAAAENGNAAASGILARSARRMAAVVSALTSLLDVERVVFGGPFWPPLSATYLARVPDIVRQLSVTSDVHALDMAGTRLSGEEAVGAACLVMEKTFSPNAGQLLLDAKG